MRTSGSSRGSGRERSGPTGRGFSIRHGLAVAALLVAPASCLAAPAARTESVGDADTWPGNRRGLAFLWQDASRRNQVLLPGGRDGPTCRVRARGRAKLYRFHDMDLAGGAFLAEDADTRLLAACKASGELTVEAVLTPASARQTAPARIVTFSSGASSRNFTLAQEGEKLVLLLRTPSNGENGTNAQPVLCTLLADKTHHVIVTYARGVTRCYLDGRAVSTSRAVRGDLSNWRPQHLLFGDEWDGGADWAGRLEGIAIYSRAVDAAEAKRKHTLYARRLARRRPVERLVLTGRLVEVTPTPTVRSIHPYRRCLAVYTYQVEKVEAGRYTDRRILVAHWVILDRKPAGFSRKRGRSYRLVVEAIDGHPQLAPERRVMIQDELDLELYYDVEN